jgi:hypothetical protein
MSRKEKNMNENENVLITEDILNVVKIAIDCAVKYGKITKNKRKLGITGEVGEVFACKQFGLKLILDSQSAGFDAIDKNGSRVQIKTRRSESGKSLRDLTRLSRFSRHEFDYCLLLLLDENYQIYELWKADYKDLLPLIEKQKNRNPSLGSFKKVAVRVI